MSKSCASFESMHNKGSESRASASFSQKEKTTSAQSMPAPVIQRSMDVEELDKLTRLLVKKLPPINFRETELDIQNEVFDVLGSEFDHIGDFDFNVLQDVYLQAELHHDMENFFEFAGPSKQVVAFNGDFDGIEHYVNRLLSGEIKATKAFDPNTYRDFITRIQADPRKQLGAYKKLKELVGRYNGISGMTWQKQPEIHDKVVKLLSWLVPLHEEVVKGIDNKAGLMNNIKILLENLFNEFDALNGGEGLPKKALLYNNPTKKIMDQQLGTTSEILTAKPGAIYSGEKAEGRVLESKLNESSDKNFIAGHMVAGSLGGKFRDDNLTPLTNAFNTSNHGMAKPENEGRKRLNEGKVIFYRTNAQYGNAHLENGNAFLPTNLKIDIATMRLVRNGDAANIMDYKEMVEKVTFTPNVATTL